MNKISVQQGSFHFGDSITFNGCDNIVLDILLTDSLAFNDCIFQDCDIKFDNTPLSFSSCEFVDSDLEVKSGNVTIDESDFENSASSFNDLGTVPLKLAISSCTFTGNTLIERRLTITSYDNFRITDNVFEDCYLALGIYESGWGNMNLFSGNSINDNTGGFSLEIYHSYIKFTEDNIISDNSSGMIATNKSSLYIVGNIASPYQKIMSNANYQMVFDHKSFPVIMHYNNIYTATQQNLVTCVGHDFLSANHDVTKNYWGNNFKKEIAFDPPDVFNYLPVWVPNVVRDAQQDSLMDYYESALLDLYNGDYPEARQKFTYMIETYPDSYYCQASLKDLLSVERNSEGDFTDLQFYYNGLMGVFTNTETIGLTDYLQNYCNIENEDYGDALQWYFDLLENSPTVIDSICAEIDIAYIYQRINSNSSRILLNPNYPVRTTEEYYEYRAQKLNELYAHYLTPDAGEEIPSVATLMYNYPNPFNPETSIKFSIPETSTVEITIYNIKGQKVKSLINEEMERGIHEIVWDSRNNNNSLSASGVYFYLMKADNKVIDVRKCLLLK
jgi:hypothetical protein